MSTLGKETVHNLARLSRIHCTPEEEENLLEDLRKILTYFEMLNDVDTEGVSPCNHILGDVHNVMRDDEVGTTMPRDLFLSNAPSHTGGMIKVEKVITRSQ